MVQQIRVPQEAVISRKAADGSFELLPDLAYRKAALVNCVFVGKPGGSWILVDAAIKGAARGILDAARSRFGKKPDAIVLTHAHFDHVGALEELLDQWDVPVYAHELEHPYLRGLAAYPPPDSDVGGGLMAATSGLLPRGPIDIGGRLNMLPSDGTIPLLADWRWIHTPGHTPGHISLFRDADRALIAGDAFITTAQESAYAVLTQEPEIHGPPMYYTINWRQAERSVNILAQLNPELVITGHGRAMHGPEMREALHLLALQFEEVAVPENGRYVITPLDAESGSAYVAVDPGAGGHRHG